MTSEQELLRNAWRSAKTGNLSPLSECKAWALREVWREEKDTDHGLLVFVAARLKEEGLNQNGYGRTLTRNH